MAQEYPSDPIGVRNHIEQQNTQGMRYYFNGQWHFMLQDEIDAIEQSGRSVDQYGRPMTAQAYGITECPNEWPAPTVPFVPLMEARPGAVEPWLRPVHCVVDVPRKDRPYRIKAKDGLIHMYRIGSHVTACGSRALHSEIWGFMRFERIVDHERACPKCKVEWLGHWVKRKRNDDKVRSRNKMRETKTNAKSGDYVKPMLWSVDEKKRLNKFREAPSGFSTHGKRVPERGSATDHRTVR